MKFDDSIMLGCGPGVIIEIVRDLKPECITKLGEVLSLHPTKYAASLLQLISMGKWKVHLRTECRGYFIDIPATVDS